MNGIVRTTVLLSSLILASLVHAGPFDCGDHTTLGTPSEQGIPLCRKGYGLAYNPDRKTPDWVAEHLTKDRVSAKGARKNYFKADPDLPPKHRAQLADYKNSGYDRGHLAPAGDMKWDLDAYKESFYLSNMAPQNGPMNQGIWSQLEANVRRWAQDRDELYIYTGPIYDEEQDEIETIGAHEVAVPNGFYKIVFDPARKEAIAFMMPNEKLETKDTPQYIVSIDSVEQATGLDFLSTLPDDEEESIESTAASALW